MELSVLAKAFRLVEHLAEAADECALGELARAAGLPKPTAHRLLRELGNLGYVERPGVGMYRLSRKLRDVVTGPGQRRLLDAAEPVLRHLHAQTGETVNLAILRGDRVVYLLVLESPHPLRRNVEPNETDPCHSTALGRAMLAHLDPARRQALLRRAKLERRTIRTITDRSRLEQLLDRVRSTGYAVEIDENDLGVMCIGAAVFEGSAPTAAVSVSAVSARVDVKARAKLIAGVKDAAASIGRVLSVSNKESTP